MNNKILVVFISLVFSSFSSFAGFIVEPLIGYQQGTVEYKFLDTVGGTSDKGTVNGLRYGLNLGYKFPFKMLLGFDYTMANLENKFDNPTATAGTKSTQTAYYLTAGYQATNEGRVGVGIGSFESTDDGSPKTKLSGATLKAYAGYEFQSHVSMNVEYILYTLNDINTEGQSTYKFKDLYDKFNYTAMVISFSFPFEFGK